MNVNRMRTVAQAAPQARRDAVAGPPVTRAQAHANTGPVARAADSKKKPADDDDDKDDEMSKYSAENPTVENSASAGTASGPGGFEPMHGKADAYDANSDKGEMSAPNDSGAPNTPSGF